MRPIDADELKKCVLKWLPKDPCGRQEKEMSLETDICVSMLMEIEEQPTIQPKQRWIPVTERLPEKSTDVLTCNSVGTIEIYSLESSYDGMWYWESSEGECECLSEVIAWMPLPEPYQPKGKL